MSWMLAACEEKVPDALAWQSVVRSFVSFVEQHGTPELLMTLALGRVKECPLSAANAQKLREEIDVKLAAMDLDLTRCSDDRNDVPIDFRFLDLLLRGAGDPEVGLGGFAQGVRVGPETRMPCLPALYKQKRFWRLASQADPLNYLVEETGEEPTWRRAYASVAELSDKVVAVLEDQTGRSQLVQLTEAGARRQYPNLVVASLEAI